MEAPSTGLTSLLDAPDDPAARLRGRGGVWASIFFGVLVVAGLFTMLPGRIMHAVVFDQ